MNILEYVKARKKRKCKYTQVKRDANYHHDLGRTLAKVGEREKMEVDKDELIMPPAQDQDFIF